MSDDKEEPVALVYEREEVGNSELQEIYDYWVDLMKAGALPDPVQVDLLDLGKFLNNIYLFDVIADGSDHKCVYDGNFHEQSVPVFKKDDIVGQMAPSSFRTRVSGIFDAAVTHRQPVQMRNVRSVYEGQEYRRIDILCLPLSKDGETVCRTLTAANVTQDVP